MFQIMKMQNILKKVKWFFKYSLYNQSNNFYFSIVQCKFKYNFKYDFFFSGIILAMFIILYPNLLETLVDMWFI